MIGKNVKNCLKNTFPFQAIKAVSKHIRENKEIRNWYRNGRQAPPPHAIKQSILRNYGERYSLSVLVETGTYMGDMVYALRKSFKKIYSIELDETLYKNAKAKFSKLAHISVINGDSSKVLPSLLSRINEACLFWLDGHFSGGVTARGDVETPIMQELRHIFDHPLKTHVIVIDDARCFTGLNNYPTIPQLQEFVLTRRPEIVFEILDDIIRIYPRTDK